MARGLNLSYKDHPEAYFFSFLLSSVLLSYAPLTLAVKLAVFLFGVAGPLALGLAGIAPQAPRGIKAGDSRAGDLDLPVMLILVLALAGVVLRLFHLETLSVWPVLDEGRNAYFSMELSRHWDWKFFRDISQMPPLYYWCLGLFFKMVPPSLFSLWLFPALLSLGLVPIGYFAARRFFPRSESLLFGCFLSVSFYPAYVGRFNHQAVLMLLWEFLSFWVLGKLLTLKTPDQNAWAGLLGLCLGTGFYIFFGWPLVALAAGIGAWFGSGKNHKKVLFVGGSTFLLSVLPLVAAGLHEGYGSYIHSLSAGGKSSWWEWGYNSFSYISGLFWGLDTDRHAYKPFWGGYLNPLAASCFGIGFLELWRTRKSGLSMGLCFFLVLFLLPAFISKEIEMFRIVQVLPIVLMIAALGLRKLASLTPRGLALVWIGIFFGLSIGLDFYHLAGPYHQACATGLDHWGTYSKSAERWRAYQILKKISDKKGPGYIFSDFDPYPFDKSLVVAAEPFNLEKGGVDSMGGASWAAFMANVNYQPFLERRFPEARFDWVASDLSTMDGGLMLVVMPTDPHRKELNQWAKVDQVLRPVTEEMLNRPFGGSREAILGKLTGVYPAFQGDAFTESLFWNLLYINHSADGRFDEALRDLGQCLQKGYPTAYFFNELGGLLLSRGDEPGSEKAFESAVKAPVNHTPALENLRLIKR